MLFFSSAQLATSEIHGIFSCRVLPSVHKFREKQRRRRPMIGSRNTLDLFLLVLAAFALEVVLVALEIASALEKDCNLEIEAGIRCEFLSTLK